MSVCKFGVEVKSERLTFTIYKVQIVMLLLLHYVYLNTQQLHNTHLPDHNPLFKISYMLLY